MNHQLSEAQLERNRKGGQANAQARQDRLIKLYGPELGHTIFREQMNKLAQLGGRPSRKESAAKRRGRIARPSVENRLEMQPALSPPGGILAFKLAEAKVASAARETRSLEMKGAPRRHEPGKEFGRTTRAAGVP